MTKKKKKTKIEQKNVLTALLGFMLLVNILISGYIYFTLQDAINTTGQNSLSTDQMIINQLGSLANKTVDAFNKTQTDVENLDEKIDYESSVRSQQIEYMKSYIEALDRNLDKAFSSLKNISEESKGMYTEIHGKVSELENLSSKLDVERLKNAVVALETQNHYGSGVIVDSRGYILTNKHVVDDSLHRKIDVKTHPGTEYTAEVIIWDRKKDLALLEITKEKSFPSLDLEDQNNINVGDRVYALGNPYGLDFTVTEGIISAFRVDEIKYVQTDVSINPGSSGGPIVNNRGKIVGITTSKVMESEGLGFAVHASEIEEFLEDHLG